MEGLDRYAEAVEEHLRTRAFLREQLELARHRAAPQELVGQRAGASRSPQREPARPEQPSPPRGPRPRAVWELVVWDGDVDALVARDVQADVYDWMLVDTRIRVSWYRLLPSGASEVYSTYLDLIASAEPPLGIPNG